jgi:hypothetical protein
LEVTRRIEEVGAEPVPPEVVAPSRGERRDRNSGRVRRHNRSRPARPVDALEQRALDVELLDNRFQDPVGAFQLLEVCVEPTRRDEICRLSRKERFRFERRRALESLARDIGGEIEQQHRHTDIGEVGGDLRPHSARAQYRDRPDGSVRGGQFRALRPGRAPRPEGALRPGHVLPRTHRAVAPFKNRSTTASASASSG